MGSCWLMAQSPAGWQSAFRQAEQLYNLEAPTDESDAKALRLYQSIIASAQAPQSYRVTAMIRSGNIKQSTQEHRAARQYYASAMAANRPPAVDSVLLYESFLYIGSSYYLGNAIDSAKYFFEKASQLADVLPDNQLPDQQRLYNSLGAIYYLGGNYAQAANYFSNALRFVQRQSPDYEYDYVSIVSNIATCRQEMKAYDEAIRLYKSLLPLSMRSEVVRQNLARTYFKKGRLDSARLTYAGIQFEDDLLRIKCLNDLGRIEEAARQWRKAESYFDSAILINKKVFGTLKNKERGLSYYYKAQLAQKRGLTDEAIFWCNRSLEELYLQFKAVRPEALPEDLHRTVAAIPTFESLTLKASLLGEKYRRFHNRQDLFAAVRCYNTAFLEGNFIKRTFDNDEARIFFNVNYQPLYEAAIAAAYEAATLDEAYISQLLFFIENYKGSVLAHNLQLQQVRERAGINQQELSREKQLKDLIAIYASRINGTQQDSGRQTMRDRYVALQVELSRLQQKMEADGATAYYRYQQPMANLTLPQLQQQLDDETAVLSFFVGRQYVYLLAFSRQQVQLHRLQNNPTLQQPYQQLQQALRQQQPGMRYQGLPPASKLYQLLLQPCERVLQPCSRWVLLPDGFLSLLPFEALSTSATEPAYLVRRHLMQYHYSLSLLWAGRAQQPWLQSPVAFAPFARQAGYTQGTLLPHLPYSAQEVAAVPGKRWLHSAATLPAFLEVASQASLLHLATHAGIEQQQTEAGWISFFGHGRDSGIQLLPLQRVYNMNLQQVRLVVLSACETGNGNTLAGEGVMSLGRAFLYAGAEAVAATMWKADDQATAYLMEHFYAAIREGYAPADALQRAKLALLEDEQVSPVLKSPAYWANFVLVGPIEVGQNPSAWSRFWWLALVPLLALAALYWRKKARSTK